MCSKRIGNKKIEGSPLNKLEKDEEEKYLPFGRGRRNNVDSKDWT